MQSLLRLVYPPLCLTCDALVDSEYGLCGDCWRDTPFVHGLSCQLCGAPLPGEADGTPVHCDDCLKIARPWQSGASALIYRGNARRIVLGLKHGDRHDYAVAAAGWMVAKLPGGLAAGAIICPVPLHRLRLFQRRYNQSALLSSRLARLTGMKHVADMLIRTRRTRPHEKMSVDERFANMDGALAVNTRHADLPGGRIFVLVDDVMTSGATLGASAEVLLAAGAQEVHVLTLARAVKSP